MEIGIRTILKLASTHNDGQTWECSYDTETNCFTLRGRMTMEGYNAAVKRTWSHTAVQDLAWLATQVTMAKEQLIQSCFHFKQLVEAAQVGLVQETPRFSTGGAPPCERYNLRYELDLLD